jgi:hypothetical protein
LKRRALQRRAPTCRYAYGLNTRGTTVDLARGARLLPHASVIARWVPSHPFASRERDRRGRRPVGRGGQGQVALSPPTPRRRRTPKGALRAVSPGTNGFWPCSPKASSSEGLQPAGVISRSYPGGPLHTSEVDFFLKPPPAPPTAPHFATP